MVESLRELNRICQKPDYKKVGNWYVRHILRDAALPVTWLILHTRISANQVTIFSLLLACAGVIFLAFPGPAAFVWGVLLLQAWYYLDHVDGQIARYRKTANLTGRFLDFFTHHIVHGAILFPLGIEAFGVRGNFFYVVWGFAASFSMILFNMIHDVKYKTFFEKLQKDGGRVLETSSSPVLGSSQSPESFLKRIFSLMHKTCEIHVMMNVLTLVALIQLGIPAVDFRFILFLFYGLLIPLITFIKLTHILSHNMIDREYIETFHDTNH